MTTSSLIYALLNVWLIAVMYAFAIAQLQSKTFHRAPNWAQRGWFIVIAASMYFLLDTAFTGLPFLPIQTALRWLELETMPVRTAVMAFWLTWINVIYGIYRE